VFLSAVIAKPAGQEELAVAEEIAPQSVRVFRGEGACEDTTV
jgi:hypothetical protein